METVYVVVSLLKNKFKQLLTYALPLNLLEQTAFALTENWQENLLGLVVSVPLGKNNRLQEAIVVQVEKQIQPNLNIKQVAEIIRPQAVLSPKQIKLAQLIAKRYQCSEAHALSLFLTPGQLKRSPTLAVAKTTKLSKIPKYQRYISKILAELSATDKAKMLVEPHLTHEQTTVISEITTNHANEFLLHGVTGSGKTEIYLQLAKRAILENKTCLILVPEINLSYPMIQTFSLRFPDKCGIWHSKMSEGEKQSCREAIEKGDIKILIGTRSALFTNLSNIALIVIDEEHDNSYQSDTIPHYSASSIARLLVREQTAEKLLLASATPSIETYYRAKQGKACLLELKKRVFSVNLPRIDLVDLRGEIKIPQELILAERTEQAITNALNVGQQILLLLNRRGYNLCYLCQACGSAVKCERCDFRLVYHQNIQKLLCHYCGKAYDLPKFCPYCHQENLINFGFGTEKLAEYLQRKWPNVQVARLDQDVSQKKSAANEILSDFKHGKYQILLGTQMIAKGHDFNNIGLVVILSIDSLLAMPDYHAEERCFQLITQAAGRAGRQGQAATVLLQTFSPNQACLQAAINNDYQAFYEEQLAFRKRLSLPPFRELGLIKLQFQQAKLTQYDLNKISQTIFSLLQEISNKIKNTQATYDLTIWPLTNQSIRKVNKEYSLTIRVDSSDEAAIAYLYSKLTKYKLPIKAKLSLYLKA